MRDDESKTNATHTFTNALESMYVDANAVFDVDAEITGSNSLDFQLAPQRYPTPGRPKRTRSGCRGHSRALQNKRPMVHADKAKQRRMRFNPKIQETQRILCQVSHESRGCRAKIYGLGAQQESWMQMATLSAAQRK